MAIELTQVIGRCITMTTEDTKETPYLFQQRLSMAPQSPSEILYSLSNTPSQLFTFSHLQYLMPAALRWWAN